MKTATIAALILAFIAAVGAWLWCAIPSDPGNTGDAITGAGQPGPD